jgi:hypothetical protein
LGFGAKAAVKKKLMMITTTSQANQQSLPAARSVMGYVK